MEDTKLSAKKRKKGVIEKDISEKQGIDGTLGTPIQ